MSEVTFKKYWNVAGTASIFIGMYFVIAIFAPGAFFTGKNFLQIATQSAIVMLIGCGEFFAIVIAGIDLSVGSAVALTGMVTAKLMVSGINPALAFFLGAVACGALIGILNGSLVNLTGVHPFIITLGTLSILRGVTLVISNAAPVFGFSQTFKKIFGGTVVNWVPMSVVVALVVAALLFFITSKSTFGRNLYAIGGNREAAWFSGINLKRHVLLVFVISGVCAGIAGSVTIARLGAAEPLAGSGYETQAIAAAIIGGTSFFGGKGKIPSILIGALIIGLISNGLNMMGVETYYQQIATGTLIIFAVVLDQMIAGRK
jgi:D-allose transport system permease protein